MTNNNDSLDPYESQPCDRCGSKKRVGRIKKEKVETFSGIILVESSQIICTNKKCQEDFDIKLEEESKKRILLERDKKKNGLSRKSHAFWGVTMAKSAHAKTK